jgi:hypothetical protein
MKDKDNKKKKKKKKDGPHIYPPGEYDQSPSSDEGKYRGPESGGHADNATTSGEQTGKKKGPTENKEKEKAKESGDGEHVRLLVSELRR